MRKYNIQNYIRYKEDLKESLKNLPDYGDNYEKYTRKELTVKFLPKPKNTVNIVGVAVRKILVIPIMLPSTEPIPMNVRTSYITKVKKDM